MEKRIDGLFGLCHICNARGGLSIVRVFYLHLI